MEAGGWSKTRGSMATNYGDTWFNQNFKSASRIDHAARSLPDHLAAQVAPSHWIDQARSAARAADPMLSAFDALASAAFAVERAHSNLAPALAVLTQKTSAAVAAGWMIDWESNPQPKSRGKFRVLAIVATAAGRNPQRAYIKWVMPAAVDLISDALRTGVQA